MRYALAAGSLLLLWHLRTAAAVNVGNIELMHAVMAEGRPRPAASYAAPSRVSSEGMRRASRTFALAGHDRLALRGSVQMLLWSGDFRNAARVIDDALQHGGGIRERMLAGEAFLHAGDRGRAIAEWTAASADAGLLLPLADQLLLQVPDGAATADAPQRFSDVVAVLRTALAQPGLADQERRLVLRTIAKAYESIDDFRSAEDTLRPLASGAKPDLDALAMLADIAYRAHQWQDAERLARAAISHDSPRARWAPHYVLGLIALDGCGLDDAAGHFKDGLAASYDGDYIYYVQRWLLGVVEYERGDYPAALIEWNKYIETQPNDADRREMMRQAAAGALPRRCAIGAPPS